MSVLGWIGLAYLIVMTGLAQWMLIDKAFAWLYRKIDVEHETEWPA